MSGVARASFAKVERRPRHVDTVELSSYLEGVLHEYACGGAGNCDLEVEPVLVPRAFAWNVAVALAEFSGDCARPVRCSSKRGVLLIYVATEAASPVLEGAIARLGARRKVRAGRIRIGTPLPPGEQF